MELHQVNLDTGIVAIHAFDDFDAAMLRRLSGMVKDACRKEGTPLFDKTVLRMSIAEDGLSYMATLYDAVDDLIPLVVTAGAKNEESGRSVWKELHSLADCIDSPVRTDPRTIPTAPFVADKAIIPLPSRADAIEWSSDMSKCLGWIILYPSETNAALNAR